MCLSLVSAVVVALPAAVSAALVCRRFGRSFVLLLLLFCRLLVAVAVHTITTSLNVAPYNNILSYHILSNT